MAKIKAKCSDCKKVLKEKVVNINDIRYCHKCGMERGKEVVRQTDSDIVVMLGGEKVNKVVEFNEATDVYKYREDLKVEDTRIEVVSEGGIPVIFIIGEVPHRIGYILKGWEKFKEFIRKVNINELKEDLDEKKETDNFIVIPMRTTYGELTCNKVIAKATGQEVMVPLGGFEVL